MLLHKHSNIHVVTFGKHGYSMIADDNKAVLSQGELRTAVVNFDQNLQRHRAVGFCCDSTAFVLKIGKITAKNHRKITILNMSI